MVLVFSVEPPGVLTSEPALASVLLQCVTSRMLMNNRNQGGNKKIINQSCLVIDDTAKFSYEKRN